SPRVAGASGTRPGNGRYIVVVLCRCDARVSTAGPVTLEAARGADALVAPGATPNWSKPAWSSTNVRCAAASIRRFEVFRIVVRRNVDTGRGLCRDEFNPTEKVS